MSWPPPPKRGEGLSGWIDYTATRQLAPCG